MLEKPFLLMSTAMYFSEAIIQRSGILKYTQSVGINQGQCMQPEILFKADKAAKRAYLSSLAVTFAHAFQSRPRIEPFEFKHSHLYKAVSSAHRYLTAQNLRSLNI